MTFCIAFPKSPLPPVTKITFFSVSMVHIDCLWLPDELLFYAAFQQAQVLPTTLLNITVNHVHLYESQLISLPPHTLSFDQILLGIL